MAAIISWLGSRDPHCPRVTFTSAHRGGSGTPLVAIHGFTER
ncbi:MAG TPA: hypothetical protein VFQ08_01830 [Gaiella sp.]|nr:hypothetical protein [Gaiella sp.]